MLEGCIKTILQHPSQCKGVKSRQAPAFLNHYTSRTAAVLIVVMRLPGCPFGSAWCLVCEVCRLGRLG